MRYLERAAAGLVVIFLVAGVHRIFVTNINWDEFYYLSLIHLYRGGELALRWQTFHVHFFAWLPLVSESEVQQVIAARGVVWTVGLGTAWLIYRVAQHFCGRLGALLATVFYLSFSFVMDHGTSFRADPFCALFFLIAVHLLIDRAGRSHAMALAAMSMAIAVMFSLKSVFYAPAVAVLLAVPLFTSADRLSALRHALVFTVTFAGALAVLFMGHGVTLAPAPLADAGTYAATVGTKTLGGGDLVPAWPFVRRALLDNPLTWILIAGGLWIAGRGVAVGSRRADSVMMLALVLPLLALLIYRNAFPYFFVFLMPAAVIPAALAVDHLVARAAAPGGRAAFAALIAILVVVTSGYAVNYAKKLPDQTVAQAETVHLVHTMFPTPVPYIDRNSMIASFPKVGFFMSTWGMETYQASMRPIMADLLDQKAPPLLIANTPALDISRPIDPGNKSSLYSLFPEDFDILHENFVHHWGAIYVAGKHLALAPHGDNRTFNILVPGTYTLEAEGPVVIDGVQLAPGAHVTLARGPHSIGAHIDRPLDVILRWGQDLFVPAWPPSPQPIYTGF